MSEETETKIDVKADDIHYPSVRLRTFFLFGITTFVIGFALGGILTPYFKFKPTLDTVGTDNIDPAKSKDSALASLGPQTLFISAIAGGQPLPTNLSVQQLIQYYQDLAQSSGYVPSLEFANVEDKIEARFSFEPRDEKLQKATFSAAPKKGFMKSLILGFARGEVAGATTLAYARRDGENYSSGAILADLLQIGANPPQLAPNQFFTQKGIFEIRSNDKGSIATIDGKQIYPIPEKLLLEKNSANDEPQEGAPQILRLMAVQSSIPTFKERFILVESTPNAAPCTSKAIVYDVTHNKASIIPEPLQAATLKIANAPKSFVISGFCEDPKAKLRTEAAYNFITGEITLNHVPFNVPPPVSTSPIENIADKPEDAKADISKGNWRQTAPNRIASPYGAGGALASVSCSAGGAIYIGVAGLPAPSEGNAIKVTFGGNSGAAAAGMTYNAATKTYELNGGSRPLEAKQVLNVLKSSGSVSISGAGGKASFASPGAAQIAAISNNCATPSPAQ